MIATAIAALVTIAAIATILTLVDSWLRARHALASIRRERALLAAGFVPEVEHREMRLRRSRARALRPSLAAVDRPAHALRLRGAA
ncbi:hypothetical protein [Erythrobacter sp.]|uniref:hypothetical protein n=1 Tax=Erythrobacter sp. TaxID=1042 RepID=UPI001425F135|nr:hypothetical protein [Erythrobacter sp.]QIQ86524.1 MAG: hypothetical protein G9473_07355 [Erythrobacter sp.]